MATVSAAPAVVAPQALAPRAPVHRARWIVLAFLGALALYAWGAAPGVLDGDPAELQAIAVAGGVAHPSGYPLYVLVSRLFVLALPGDLAHRVNLMSAFFGAASVATLAAVAFEIGLGGPAALAAGILLGAGFNFWAASLRAEVYTLSMFVLLLAWWRTLVALRTDAPRHRVLAAALLGLAMTGQLSNAPMVAVLGLTLAWRAARAGRAWPEWLLLAGAFALGLTPYLEIPLADARRIGLDVLRHVDWGFFPGTGVPVGVLDTPWKRLLWVITGRDLAPGAHGGFHAGQWVRTIVDGGARVVLFETGPLLPLLAAAGAVVAWRAARAETGRQLAIVFASVAFVGANQGGPLFPVLLMPVLAIVALFGARALAALARRAPARHAVWLVPALAVLAIAPAHAIRLRAYEHPIPPGGWSVVEEDHARPMRLLWAFQDPYRFRDFGDAAMRALPESALVVSRWREMTTLYWERYALGLRPDLTFQQWTYPGTLIRARIWQETHDLARHPIVFLRWPPEMARHAAVVDSVEVSRGYRLWFVRAPLHDLPAGKGDRFVVGG